MPQFPTNLQKEWVLFHFKAFTWKGDSSGRGSSAATVTLEAVTCEYYFYWLFWSRFVRVIWKWCLVVRLTPVPLHHSSWTSTKCSSAEIASRQFVTPPYYLPPHSRYFATPTSSSSSWLLSSAVTAAGCLDRADPCFIFCQGLAFVSSVST